jgi:hypothetical protein
METMQPTSTSQSAMQRPGLVNALGIMTLVNGILNIFAGLGLTAAVVLSTLGIGLLCSPITLAPAVLGVFEIMYAAKILANPPQPVKFSQTIAILEIVCVVFGNGISLVVGILALVFYNDQSVKGYFSSINPAALVQG